MAAGRCCCFAVMRCLSRSSLLVAWTSEYPSLSSLLPRLYIPLLHTLLFNVLHYSSTTWSVPSLNRLLSAALSIILFSINSINFVLLPMSWSSSLFILFSDLHAFLRRSILFLFSSFFILSFLVRYFSGSFIISSSPTVLSSSFPSFFKLFLQMAPSSYLTKSSFSFESMAFPIISSFILLHQFLQPHSPGPSAPSTNSFALILQFLHPLSPVLPRSLSSSFSSSSLFSFRSFLPARPFQRHAYQ